MNVAPARILTASLASLACIASYLLGFAVGYSSNDGGRPAARTVTVQRCTHGESSTFAYRGRDGRMHQTPPVVTGCVP